MTERLSILLLGLIATGCGASLSELREHHVWERAVCEADETERGLVQADIEEDQQLAVAIQAVPPSAVEALSPDHQTNPLRELAIARVRPRANEVPLEAFELHARLVVDGRPVPHREVSFDELLRRTGESVPAARRVTRGGSRSVGPLEAFFRIVAGVATVGLSELFIRSVDRGGSVTVTERPSPSEIARAAPHASAIGFAAAELDAEGQVYMWPRQEPGAHRAIDLEVIYRGRGQRSEACEMNEHVVIELEPGLPLEEAIERRFGHREHTLEELRAMAI